MLNVLIYPLYIEYQIIFDVWSHQYLKQKSDIQDMYTKPVTNRGQLIFSISLLSTTFNFCYSEKKKKD